MTKTKSLLATLVLAMITALVCCVFAACGTSYAVTWDVTNATVVVEGYDELPSEVKEGTELVFTVTPAQGYAVKGVKAGKSTVKADDAGKYSATITAETTITVTTEKTIESVTVKTNPADLSYYAGEELDATGMVVELKYGTGETETITNYTIAYNSGSAFAIGDTSFAVKYGGVTSAAVALNEAVVAKVVIDPVGGEIAADWVAALEARTDIANYAVDEDGVISFTYTALTAEIVLPTAEQVSKGKPGDFTFKGWGATTIAADSAVSFELTLTWDAALIILNEMYLSYENGPFLVLDVSFKAVDSAYIYLYEGNDQVELVGDTYTASGNASDKLYFDLTKLGNHENGSYAGKWMDIKFCADIDGTVFTQEFLLDHDYPLAEVGGTVTDGVNAYTLLTYRSGNTDSLKLAFKPYNTTYGFEVENGVLTVSGQLNTANTATHAGATASLTMGAVTSTGTVAADGTWALDFNIAEIGACDATTFGNVTFDNGEATVAGDFSYTAGTTTYAYSGNKFSSPSYYANEYIAGDWAIYIGNMGSNWQTAFYSVVDIGHAIAYANVTLGTNAAGAPTLVFTGTYGSAYSEAEAIAAITEAFYCDLQQYPSWPYRWYSTAGSEGVAANFVVTAENGNFTVVCDINVNNDGAATAFAAGDIIYGHFGNSGSNMSVTFVEATVTYNGLTYTMGGANDQCASWMNGLTIIYVTEAAA